MKQTEDQGVSGPYIASSDRMYFEPVFGMWTGAVYANPDRYGLADLKSLHILKESAEIFKIQFPLSEFEFGNQKFSLVDQSFPMSELSGVKQPVVRALFQSDNGLEEIAIIGKVKSLGDLSGFMEWNRDSQTSVIATFDFYLK